MTRKYWAGVMVFSLTLTAGAGYCTWQSLNQNSGKVVPLKEVSTQTTSASAPISSQNMTQLIPAEEKPSTTSSETKLPITTSENLDDSSTIKRASSETPTLDKPASKKVIGATRNIRFAYRKASAKEVFLIASFNDWIRETMEKDEKGFWVITKKIEPGSYEYKFVVDGRKIRDPNNRLYTPEGNSILKVKPIPPE